MKESANKPERVLHSGKLTKDFLKVLYDAIGDMADVYTTNNGKMLIVECYNLRMTLKFNRREVE